jgi:hypothetical protein
VLHLALSLQGAAKSRTRNLIPLKTVATMTP